nr:uncharacterized protein LOC106031833 [Anser cygnoides]XP_047916669.1 uncharacterized protein LOC106031833 [Anser cygnoides]XP_047916670.1 uncharacterized protein LOC106031833 [Anser cygnoides]
MNIVLSSSQGSPPAPCFSQTRRGAGREQRAHAWLLGAPGCPSPAPTFPHLLYLSWLEGTLLPGKCLSLLHFELQNCPGDSCSPRRAGLYSTCSATRLHPAARASQLKGVQQALVLLQEHRAVPPVLPLPCCAPSERDKQRKSSLRRGTCCIAAHARGKHAGRLPQAPANDDHIWKKPCFPPSSSRLQSSGPARNPAAAPSDRVTRGSVGKKKKKKKKKKKSSQLEQRFQIKPQLHALRLGQSRRCQSPLLAAAPSCRMCVSSLPALCHHHRQHPELFSIFSSPQMETQPGGPTGRQRALAAWL